MFLSKILKFLESQNLRIPVIVVGIHLTSVARVNEMDFLNDGFSSYVIGEGFNAVTKMCDDIQNGGLKKIYSEPILKDVNELPFAALDLEDAIMETDRKAKERERKKKEG